MPVDLTRVYSARTAFGRLFHYAKRCRGMLLVGLLSGMVAGGSWFGILHIIPLAMQQMGVAGNFAFLEKTPRHKEDVQQADEAAAVVHAQGLRTDEENVPRWHARAQTVADYFNIPLETAGGRISWQFLALSFMIFPIIIFLRVAMLFANHYCLRWTGARVVRDLRNDLFDHLQKQSLKFYSQVEVGQLISRCTNDTMTIELLMSVTVADALRAPFEILGAAAFIVYFAMQQKMVSVLLIAVVVLPLCLIPLLKLGRRVRKWSRRNLERMSIITQRMHENLTGIRVVKAYHSEAYESQRFHAVNQQQFKTVLRGTRAELLITPAMEAVNMLMIAVFFIYCYAKGLTLLQIVPIATGFVIFYKPLKQLGKIQTSIERGHAALNRIFSLFDSDTCLPEATHPVSKTTFETAIEFRDISFSYQEGSAAVIDHAVFEIKHGEMVAVVGATGSGKTTLANLLARFYDPTAGSVIMDGVDIRQISMGDLRKLIGVVTQETILFNDTIAQNICYGSFEATREQIVAAAQMANAHQFIAAHSEGYERVVGDKGFVLSGGERQRIAIARAILHNAPILILDEATSALDTVTERLVQDALNLLMTNRTVFVIAHRLSTIRKADLILVMDQGRIVERGTHDQLYQAEGQYRKLCDMQSSGVLP